jgi:hypothetical protein
MADLDSSLASVLQVPGLQELLNSSITRQRELAPVRTAVSQQAVNMLPNAAFNRPNIGGIERANYTTPPPKDSGTDWAKILSLLGAGAAGGDLLKKIIDALKGSGGDQKGGGSGGDSGGKSNSGNIIDGLKNLFKNPNDPNNWALKPGSEFGGNHTSTYDGGSDPWGNNLPSYDPFYNWSNESMNYPSDPSRGTGVGPGMAAYYAGGGGSSLPDEDSWGDE